MTNKEQANQLRLAAGILETGHPYEIDDNAGGGFRKPLAGENPGKVAFINGRIRPILATPPDGRALHNPDNLTAERVGVGYRLTLAGELDSQPGQQYWSSGEWHGSWIYKVSSRLPLSVPWPELPDQYAELKAAHKEGRVIEGLIGGHWILCSRPTWEYPVETYRIKPEPEPFQLPPPPPGIEWHRKDGWKAGDLPQGYRPLVAHEVINEVDEINWGSGNWCLMDGLVGTVVCGDELTRTTRPLTFTHLGKTWTWHKAGDPMPCGGEQKVSLLLQDLSIGATALARQLYWDAGLTEACQIIGWRYAEPATKTATKTADLGPEDVPPGSVFRCIQWSYSKCWLTARSVRDNGVELTNDFGWATWHNLAEGFQINRPANRDADGNPTAWEPCHKQIPA